MKDNLIIALLLVLIALFLIQFHNASSYLTHEDLDGAVAQTMETYLQLNGYAE